MWKVRTISLYGISEGVCVHACSCYGAESDDIMCCNTCEEVREAYRRKGWAVSNPKVSLKRRREGED